VKISSTRRAAFAGRNLASVFLNVIRQVARLVSGFARRGLGIPCCCRKKVRKASRKTRVFFEMP
jgi:hypothetical protein